MNRSISPDKASQRVKAFSSALVIIGPMAVTWGASITVAATSLLLYPILPENDRYALLIGSWVILIPVMTVISLVVILATFRVMLWSVEAVEKRPRDVNGRYAPIKKNGSTVEYLVAVPKNQGKGQ